MTRPMHENINARIRLCFPKSILHYSVLQPHKLLIPCTGCRWWYSAYVHSGSSNQAPLCCSTTSIHRWADFADGPEKNLGSSGCASVLCRDTQELEMATRQASANCETRSIYESEHDRGLFVSSQALADFKPYLWQPPSESFAPSWVHAQRCMFVMS